MNYFGNYQIIQHDTKQYQYKLKPFNFIGNIKNLSKLSFDINDRINNNLIYQDIYTIKKTGGLYFHQPIDSWLIKRYLQLHNIQKLNKAASVENGWGLNYYHCLLEELPNILKIQKFDQTLPIICSYNNTYVKSIFDYFNIKNPIISSDRPFDIDELFLTTPIKCGNPSGEDLNLIRNYLKENKQLKFDQKTNIGILIFRKEQLRNLVNVVEVYEMLLNEFPTIDWQIFDSLSFSETVNLFNNAKIIIGPHGAGFANMIFSPNNTKIIELMPVSEPNIVYYDVASMLDFDYYCMPIQDSGKQNECQMNVNINILKNELKNIII
jgi:capsular polysaccharide biosynthesis protein